MDLIQYIGGRPPWKLLLLCLARVGNGLESSKYGRLPQLMVAADKTMISIKIYPNHSNFYRDYQYSFQSFGSGMRLNGPKPQKNKIQIRPSRKPDTTIKKWYSTKNLDPDPIRCPKYGSRYNALYIFLILENQR